MPYERDESCPLGFHPQTRWPTRCKRCFREYKDHAQKKKEQDDPLKYSSRRDYSDLSTTRTRSFDLYDNSFSKVIVTTTAEEPRSIYSSPSTSLAASPSSSLSSSTSSSYRSLLSPSRETTVRSNSFDVSSSSSSNEKSIVKSTEENTNSTEKDFSTAFSSLSPEALSRLNKRKEEWRTSSNSSSFEEPNKSPTPPPTAAPVSLSSASSSTSLSTKVESPVLKRREISKSPQREKKEEEQPTKKVIEEKKPASPLPKKSSTSTSTTTTTSSSTPTKLTLRPKKVNSTTSNTSNTTTSNTSNTSTSEKSPSPSPSSSSVSNGTSVAESFTVKIKKSNSFNKEKEKSDENSSSTSNNNNNSCSASFSKPSSSPTSPPPPKTITSSSATSTIKPNTSPVSSSSVVTPISKLKSSSIATTTVKSEPELKAKPKSPLPEKKDQVVPSSPSAASISSSSNSSDSSNTTMGVIKKPKVKKTRLLIQGVQEVTPTPPSPPSSSSPNFDTFGYDADSTSTDVAFIISVKSKTKKKRNDDDDDETMSLTTTTDTETTLVDVMEQSDMGISSWEIDDMKEEMKRLRVKCDKYEKEKSEELVRRVSNLSMDQTRLQQSSEHLKLQQKVNQLTTLNEDLKDEQKHLETRIRELENELSMRPSLELAQRTVTELQNRLSSSEAVVEQLTEEKRDVIRQMNEMQEEFEEMQDNFREEQSEEFATVKKELDEATKNFRLMQFKLRKLEKRCDQLEAEKKELEGQIDNAKSGKIAKLEEELEKFKNENEKLLKSNTTTTTTNKMDTLSPLKKKSPVLTKAPSGEKVDPPTLSPEVDNSQLLRDFQATVERESDLREQLKFAEEEVNGLRQKISRIEEENESLLIQIKKMSIKSKSDMTKGKEPQKGNQNSTIDPNELKIQYELNEQESKILRRKVEELENSNNKLTKNLQESEDKIRTIENSPNMTKSKSIDEVSLLRRKIIEKEREVERLETELLAASKTKGKMIRSKSFETEEGKKLEETKSDLKKTQSDLSKTRQEAEEQKKILEDELQKARKDVENHQIKIVQTIDLNRNLQGQVEKFKIEFLQMKDHYEEIQDSFVIKNSQLEGQKEQIEHDYDNLRREHDTIDKELRTLRETFNTRQDSWIKEKLSIQDKLREMEENAKKLMSLPGDTEMQKIKVLLKEQTKEHEVKKHEISTYQEQIQYFRKENEELRLKLEDFERVTQIQMRSLMTVEPPKQDNEIKSLKERLHSEEKLHKNEIGQVKLRHDKEIAQKIEEISGFQSQLSRAKRERDTFRQMVDSAQRAIAELKSRERQPGGQMSSGSISGLEEAATGARAAVITLQERVQSLEDDLSEARRETSRGKTDLSTERSTLEMKLGEMQQKINELEEERLIGTGRARAAGQRTRLELAWQKEREEQQRRLKETTTLARDLKNTLLEIEREKDREKLEAKRRIEQLKSTMEEEQEDMKRKVGETQDDLLELRDAHAKLRTANEKLRRDRERLEKEKEHQTKKELEFRKINGEKERILDQLIHRLNSASQTSLAGGQTHTNVNANEVLHYLKLAKDIREAEDFMNPREKRRSTMRRAASAGADDDGEFRQSHESLVSAPGTSAYGREQYGSAGGQRRQMKYLGSSSSSSTLTLPSKQPHIKVSTQNNSSSSGSLYRKSLSLEQALTMPDDQKIWKGESDAGSGQSISSMTSMDSRFSRGSSIDRMSSISAKTDKPKGSSSLVGKVKKFVKSKSIEDNPIPTNKVGSSKGSDISLNNSEMKDSGGKTIKDKVKGIFKKRDRSPSVERPKIAVQVPTPISRNTRETTPSSMQRPLKPSTK